MGNQAESFEDRDPDDHGISEQASQDAKDDAMDRPTVHTNGDTDGMKPSNGTDERDGGEENGGGNPYLQAILPDGGEYDEGGEDENEESTKPSSESPGVGVASSENPGVGVGTAKKKKKTKTKSKSKRGLTAPTGFEEFYVDTPLTPAEHAEEKGLYHESISFSERIQTAIQRYFARRNLNSERKDVFDKYMAYGGIDSGPKMFAGGLDKNTISNKNSEEIAALKATHFASVGRGGPNDPNYVVDFESCAQGFFSSRLPSVFDLMDQPRIKSFTAIIRNFLNYILHHDVCPEYNDQVQAARRVCDQAEQELWKIAQANKLLPGNFNRACSDIFGGIYQGLYIGDQEWAEGVEDIKGMSPETARKTFRVAMVAQGSEDMFKKYNRQGLDHSARATSVFDASMEVTELIPPSKEVRALYNSSAGQGLQPVGLLRAKSWLNPCAYPEDLTVEEEEAAGGTEPTEQYEFWVEEELLRHCFVGMKLETTVHRTSFGVDYFDSMAGVWCSFFRLLPNEMEIGWREPGPMLPMREKPGDGKDGAGQEEGEGAGEEGDF